MPTAPDIISPVLTQLLSFMEEALESHTKSASQLDELKLRMQQIQKEQDKVILEKVAAERKNFFDKTALDSALSKLKGMGIIDEGGQQKLAKKILENPNVVFTLLTKVAEVNMTASAEGSGVAPESEPAATRDPDGWDDMAEGKPVTLRRK